MEDHNKKKDISYKGTTNKPFAGQGGRPRAFQDEAIFQATTRVIAEVGFARCSLEAVASEIGCTGQALSRRFGSKRGLVGAYLEWVLERSAERFRSTRNVHGSPIEALRARCLIPAEDRPEEIGDPTDVSHRANTATFWAAIRCDPDFRAKAQTSVLETEAEVTQLLDAAIGEGELIPCNTTEIGRTLTAAWVGANSLWSGDGPDGTLVDRLLQVFETIIGPYRMTQAFS